MLAPAFLVLLAGPAAADPAEPGDVRSEVTAVTPATDGLTAEVVGGDSFLRLLGGAGPRGRGARLRGRALPAHRRRRHRRGQRPFACPLAQRGSSGRRGAPGRRRSRGPAGMAGHRARRGGVLARPPDPPHGPRPTGPGGTGLGGEADRRWPARHHRGPLPLRVARAGLAVVGARRRPRRGRHRLAAIAHRHRRECPWPVCSSSSSAPAWPSCPRAAPRARRPSRSVPSRSPSASPASCCDGGRPSRARSWPPGGAALLASAVPRLGVLSHSVLVTDVPAWLDRLSVSTALGVGIAAVVLGVRGVLATGPRPADQLAPAQLGGYQPPGTSASASGGPHDPRS